MSPSLRLLRTAAVALPLLALTAGCIVAPARSGPPVVEIVAPKPPPPIRYEAPPPPPPERAEAVFWVPGRWHWDGREYAWQPGHYEERPFHQARWEPGHWAERPNGSWVWVDGHWR